MSRSPLWPLCAVILLVWSVQGRAESRPAAPPEVSVVLHDGTVLKGVTPPASVEVLTKYGRLTVPLKDVRRIEIGLRLTPDESRVIETAIRRLGSQKPAEWQEAVKQLIALGRKAYPALVKSAAGKDMEVARRAAALVQKMQQAVPAHRFPSRSDDTITTADCVLVGRLTDGIVKARSKTLGELRLNLADVRSLHGAEDKPTQAAPAVQAQQAGMAEIVQLVQSGAADAVIINKIRTSGVVYRLTAEHVLYLKQNNVSDAVITEMQATAFYPTTTG